jgi:archaemetzincin
VSASINILNGSSLVRPSELETIAGNISGIYGLPVHSAHTGFDLRNAFDSARGQYNSTLMLAGLSGPKGAGSPKQIGIVDVDLFIPVLTFVFGEAELDGHSAIVSTHRLSNQYYGLRRSHDLLLSRLEKELIHELGHTFGMYHCRQFECVMRSSTYVEEIDMKKALPCPQCTARLLELLAAG